jgi:hypothetical protein
MLVLVRCLVLVLRALLTKRRLELALENAALRHQLEVLAGSRKRAPLRPTACSGHGSPASGRAGGRHLVIVQPETVLRWHRIAWRRYWTWKSKARRPGRPRIDDELAELIRQMSEENPRWGHMRVLGELRKLGFRVSLQTVRRYRQGVRREPEPSMRWRTFLLNHRTQLWAADFFTVQTLTMRTLYVFFISHGRREVVHLGVTAHPTAQWVWRQLIEATPWGRQPGEDVSCGVIKVNDSSSACSTRTPVESLAPGASAMSRSATSPGAMPLRRPWKRFPAGHNSEKFCFHLASRRRHGTHSRLRDNPARTRAPRGRSRTRGCGSANSPGSKSRTSISSTA